MKAKRHNPVTVGVMPHDGSFTLLFVNSQCLSSMKVSRRDGAFGFLIAICLSLFLLFSLAAATLFSVWFLSRDKHLTSLVSLVLIATQIVPIFGNVLARVAYGPKNNLVPLVDNERLISQQRLRQYVWQTALIIGFGVVLFCTGKDAPLGLSVLAHAGRLCIGFAAIIIGTGVGYRSLLWTTELKPADTPLEDWQFRAAQQNGARGVAAAAWILNPTSLAATR